MTARTPRNVRDLISPMLAGLVAVLVSGASNLPLFVQMFVANHVPPAQAVSSLTSMYLTLAVLGAALCLWYRAPIILGWNTAGIAVLIAEGPRFPFTDVIGALLISGLTLTLLGLTGVFDRLATRLPPPLASALLAGVLLPFVLRGMAAVPAAPALLVPVILTYLLGRAFSPRWAVPLAVLAGMTATVVSGAWHVEVARPLGQLVFAVPTFDLGAILAISVPCTLFAVASQHLPGLAILHASGFRTVPARPLVTLTGAASMLVAPLGSITLNLGAITAAICTGPDAHPDPARRFVAGLSCSAGYLTLGLAGGALIALVGAFPAPLLQGLAGVALLGPLMSGREGTLAQEPRWREAALLTLVVTASGVTWLGLSGAVWGLALGWGWAWLKGWRAAPSS